MGIYELSIPDGGDCWCKDVETGAWLRCLRNRDNISMASTERSSGRLVEQVFREFTWGYTIKRTLTALDMF